MVSLVCMLNGVICLVSLVWKEVLLKLLLVWNFMWMKKCCVRWLLNEWCLVM